MLRMINQLDATKIGGVRGQTLTIEAVWMDEERDPKITQPFRTVVTTGGFL